MEIKNTVLLNPAISSLNMGDHIISLGVKKQLEPIIKNNFVVEVSTHLPISRLYIKNLKKADYKFVCGSNLLRGKMNRIFRQWDIRLDQADLVKDSILVGAGWWQYGDNPNWYTKSLYNKVLSKKYIHSVRDEYTKKQLESIGIKNVLNTSCATMWDLTEEHCTKIPKEKQKDVVFTLTDYNKDTNLDKKLIQILLLQYDNVYFWLQGLKDYEYIKSLNVDLDKIKMIPPTVEAFDKVLDRNSIEYVGTRLHAGIRALQHEKRTIIIGIDNRAIEKKRDFNINVLERNNLDELTGLINQQFDTHITIPINAINEWKAQFK